MYAVRNHGHTLSLFCRMNKLTTGNNNIGLDNGVPVSYF